MIKIVSKTIKNEAKEQKREFLSMLVGTLSTTLLANIFTEKGVTKASEGAIRPRKGTIRVGQDL